MKRMIALLLVIGLSTAALGAAKAYDVTPFGNSVGGFRGHNTWGFRGHNT